MKLEECELSARTTDLRLQVSDKACCIHGGIVDSCTGVRRRVQTLRVVGHGAYHHMFQSFRVGCVRLQRHLQQCRRRMRLSWFDVIIILGRFPCGFMLLAWALSSLESTLGIYIYIYACEVSKSVMA